MADPVIDAIFAACMDVLEMNGILTRVNELRFSVVYQDDKISIRGLLDPGATKYIRMTVRVNIPSEPDSKALPEPMFGLPDKVEDDNWTVVYVWRTHMIFFRDGHWKPYLGKLKSHIDSEIKKARSFNNVKVDDAALFGED